MSFPYTRGGNTECPSSTPMAEARKALPLRSGVRIVVSFVEFLPHCAISVCWFFSVSCFFSVSFGYFGFPTLLIFWILCDTLISHLNFCSRIYADVFWILSIWHLIRPWLLIINLCVNVYHCLLFFLFCFCPCLLSSVSFALLFCLSVPTLAFPVLFSRNPIQFAIVSLTVTLHFLQPFVLQTFTPASDH